MIVALQVLCVILVALAMIPSVAHALELPGKMRLSKETYHSVQAVYWPGFTVTGIAEPIAIIATVVLLLSTSMDGIGWWLILLTLIGLVAMHAVYWLFTHPVNNFWLRKEKLGAASAGFFAFGTRRGARKQGERPVDWTDFRNRWEYSHVARAGCAAVAFVSLVIAVSAGV